MTAPTPEEMAVFCGIAAQAIEEQVKASVGTCRGAEDELAAGMRMAECIRAAAAYIRAAEARERELREGLSRYIGEMGSVAVLAGEMP